MVLKRSFFERKTIIVAQDLLGKFLVRRIGQKIISGMIVETEAYVGPHDLACHASKGKTERTKVMFESAGTWYVYMIYGMYYCLNIVTEEKDYPAAVLIRALEPVEGQDQMAKNRRIDFLSGISNLQLTNGPAKLCRALKINKELNCSSAINKDSKLYVEDKGIKISQNKIVKAKRIGVDYAGEWKNKPFRFYIKENKFVSKN